MNKTKVLLTSVYSHSLCIFAPFLRLLFYLLIMNRGIKTVATTAFCCLVALTGCNKQQQAMDTGSYKTMTVKTDSIVLQSLYSARIEGRQDVEIYPQVSGTLQRLCVQEGDRVKKGQTLFIIDQVPYQAALNGRSHPESSRSSRSYSRFDIQEHQAPVRSESRFRFRFTESSK